MPPRIPLFQCLKAQNANPSPVFHRTFSSTPSIATQTSTATQRKRHRDPYAVAQAKARKTANLSRQEVLKKERAAVLGDPVRGTETPFVRSFDTALPPEPSPADTFSQTRTSSSPSKDAPGAQAKKDDHLNFFLDKKELDDATKYSKWISTPSQEEQISEDYRDNLSPEERERLRASQQDNAEVALQRIASLSLGSSQDRRRINTQRCIDTFGRHHTDATLPAKPRSANQPDNGLTKMERIGPDTGSSEVQIAILTAKIRTLADFLQSRGTMDKVNKRNLRLLVHRRQKHLLYLRRKERGGPRWQHVVETLGLGEGTWKGEISL